jgi:hypothetical protein
LILGIVTVGACTWAKKPIASISLLFGSDSSLDKKPILYLSEKYL